MPNCGNCAQPIHPVTGEHRPGDRCALARIDEPIPYAVTVKGQRARRFDAELNAALGDDLWPNDDPNRHAYD
jgi:hypothetical protein